jgi:UDP:flavonoid glycosyltransferase YjiC (YdhE family)
MANRTPHRQFHLNNREMKQSVILYPSAGTGHVIPMAELAKVFINHGFDVTMVIVPPFSGQFKRVAAANPSISFHVLPPDVPPPDDVAGSGSGKRHPLLFMLKTLRRYNEKLESFLCSIPRQRLHSLVIDMFCADAIDVAARLGVPVYTFAPSSASALAVLTQIPALLASRQTGLKELGDTPLEFLGVPPMPASHLIAELLEHPEDELCSTMASIFRRGMDTGGVLVNTFQSLEIRALQALSDPQCVPGKVLPPIYCVGPLVGNSARDPRARADERHECLRWLDAQPERSVVFLCFGSMGAFSQEQLKEIATGLDKSGHRFLWVVRRPASSIYDPKRFQGQQPKLDLDAVLPEGFLERTRGRGLVVRSWAPQVEVLQHPATGSFVTHCGWNSMLEGVMAGVPMLCWPLYAEQKMNKVFMTQDMGVGVEMEGCQTGFVKAEVVEAKVRLVTEAEEGRQLRVRVAARTKEAAAAMEPGGSSHAAFAQFLADVRSLRRKACRL